MNSYAPIKVEGQSPAEQSEHGFHSTPPSSNSASPPDDIEWFRRGPSARTLELVSSTHIRLARSVRGTERQRAYGEQEHDAPGSEPFSSYYRSQITPPVLHAATSSSKSKRIPRPPNAFILYRSHILNEARIPDDIERRQQTLSRVAGQCWNLLRPAEKKPWQDLAAKRAAIHQLEHPDYHFKPSPRGKSKAKLRSNEEKSDEVIRSLRETYLGILGPSICASRQRKPKSQVQEEKPTPSSHQSTLASSPSDTPGSGAFHWPSAAGSQGPSYQSTPASTPSLSPFDAQGMSAYAWSFSSSPSASPSPSLPSPEPASNEAPLPPCFPQRTFPHFAAPRRPSTSLGFVRKLDEDAFCFEPGHGLERPASAASETGLTHLVRDLNLTPTVANFGHILMPTASDMYGMSSSTDDQANNILSPFPFTAMNGPLGSPFPDTSSDLGATLSSTMAFPDAQFPMTLDDSYTFNHDQGTPFFFDDWSFGDINQPMGAGNQ